MDHAAGAAASDQVGPRLQRGRSALLLKRRRASPRLVLAPLVLGGAQLSVALAMPLRTPREAEARVPAPAKVAADLDSPPRQAATICWRTPTSSISSCSAYGPNKPLSLAVPARPLGPLGPTPRRWAVTRPEAGRQLGLGGAAGICQRRPFAVHRLSFRHLGARPT